MSDRRLTAAEVMTAAIARRLADVDRAATRRRLRATKRVSNDRLRADGYEFDVPTFREGYRAAIERYRADDTDS